MNNAPAWLQPTLNSITDPDLKAYVAKFAVRRWEEKPLFGSPKEFSTAFFWDETDEGGDFWQCILRNERVGNAYEPEAIRALTASIPDWKQRI